jgi:hypothetical protein
MASISSSLLHKWRYCFLWLALGLLTVVVAAATVQCARWTDPSGVPLAALEPLPPYVETGYARAPAHEGASDLCTHWAPHSTCRASLVAPHACEPGGAQGRDETNPGAAAPQASAAAHAQGGGRAETTQNSVLPEQAEAGPVAPKASEAPVASAAGLKDFAEDFVKEDEEPSLLPADGEMVGHEQGRAVVGGVTAWVHRWAHDVSHELRDAASLGVARAQRWLNVSGPTLGLSAALGVAGLAVGVPYVPGLTDNFAVGLVGAAAPVFNHHKVFQAVHYIIRCF